MDELLQDGNLASLHRAALDTALRTVEMQMEDPKPQDFVDRDLPSDVAAQ